MAFPIDQLLLPPRLALRALDDLHSIARAAASLGSLADEMAGNREQLVARLDGVTHSVEEISPQVEALRKEIKDLPEHVDGLRDAFEGSNREVNRVHGAIAPMNSRLETLTTELARVRGSIAPLGGEIRQAVDRSRRSSRRCATSWSRSSPRPSGWAARPSGSRGRAAAASAVRRGPSAILVRP